MYWAVFQIPLSLQIEKPFNCILVRWLFLCPSSTFPFFNSDKNSTTFLYRTPKQSIRNSYLVLGLSILLMRLYCVNKFLANFIHYWVLPKN